MKKGEYIQMAKTGPARPNSHQPSTPEDPDQIDTQIENLTLEVAKAAKVNSTPIFIGLIIVIGLITLPSIFGSLKDRQLQAWNNQIDTTLAGEADQVRQAYPGLLTDVEGQAMESLAIGRVARWLWDQGTDVDQQQAVALLEESQRRLPDDFLIKSYLQEFSTSRDNSAGFVLPEIPEPILLEPTPAVTTTTDEPVKPTLTTDEPVKPTLTTDEPTKPTLTTDEPARPVLTTDEPAKPALTTDEPTKPTLTTDEPAPPVSDPVVPDESAEPTDAAEDLGPPAPATGSGGD
ncbi:MAG: hypothetical protein ABGY15_06145 [bacterium]